MIAHIEGKVIHTTEKFIIVDVSGIGYKVYSTPDIITSCGDTPLIKLFTHLAVRENALDLYGFKTLEELEFFGVDQRHESDIEGLGRIPADQQLKTNKIPSFNVIGNSPLVLRESLLDEVYTMGENFVNAAKRVVSPGMNGPFCIEGVYDENAKFTSFEFSARIVAGSNIYMDGSPYYSLLFNETMSMGKRIAREVKTATETNQLDKITT